MVHDAPISEDDSPHLAAAGAAWDDGPQVGRWIADRLAPFGPSVGHAVPLGYAAYAVAPLWPDDDADVGRGCLAALEALIDVLERFTRDRPVHCAMWEGWSWWYARGEDPRTGVVKAVWAETEEPTQEEVDRAPAGAREYLAVDGVQRPDVAPLDLPERRCFVWTGPLASVTALHHQPQDPPALIWPEDRSWVVGAPIYTNEIAIAGTTEVIAEPRLNAVRASPDDTLDSDD